MLDVSCHGRLLTLCVLAHLVAGCPPPPPTVVQLLNKVIYANIGGGQVLRSQLCFGGNDFAKNIEVICDGRPLEGLEDLGVEELLILNMQVAPHCRCNASVTATATSPATTTATNATPNDVAPLSTSLPACQPVVLLKRFASPLALAFCAQQPMRLCRVVCCCWCCLVLVIDVATRTGAGRTCGPTPWTQRATKTV
jgi:hypothetical protein